MPKYGMLVDGELFTSSKQREGYKPIEYADIPEGFDQTTHYVSQVDPVDKGDYIYIGTETHELELTEDDEVDDF